MAKVFLNFRNIQDNFKFNRNRRRNKAEWDNRSQADQYRWKSLEARAYLLGFWFA